MNSIPTLIIAIWRGESGFSIAVEPAIGATDANVQCEDGLAPWEIGQLAGGN